MWLTRASLRNPIVVTLFYALVAIVGAVAFLRMGRSVLPPISFPVVSISAPYAGAGTEEIERLIVAPIEDRLDGIPELDRVSAFAQDGIARIEVRFRYGSDLEADRANVRQAVDAARATMPLDVLPPTVEAQDPSQAPVLEEAVSSGALSARELADVVDRRIAPAVRSGAAIGLVTVGGDAVRQFTVVPQLGALQAVGATVLDVDRSLASANDVLPGGRLRTRYQESTIGVRSAAQSAADLRELPVSTGGVAAVRVGDVARVEDGTADASTLTSVDGAPAIVISVSRAENADSMAAIASARRIFARLASQYPLVRFETLRTDAPYTNAAIAGVVQTLLEGIVLTVLVLVAFLHAWRNAVIAAVSIPASLCAAFAAMWAAGFTIDVLSLMGLSLTIGILVDDSIVIIEAISRHALRGAAPEEAALAGRAELGGAAIAITLVDVAVFAPIAFASGLVGQFMREFGLVVVFATSFSLLVSFTLAPLLAARWALPRERLPFPGWNALPWMLRTRAARAAAAFGRRVLDEGTAFEERVTSAYAARWLPAARRHARAVVLVTGVATLLSLIPAFTGAIGTEFSPPVGRGEAALDVIFPSGTPLARADAETSPLVQRLLDDPRIGHVVTTAGRGFNGTTDVVAPNLVHLDAILADPTADPDPVVERIKALQSLVPGAAIAGSGRGMGGTAPIRYTVAGDRTSADEAAARIARALESDAGATDVRVSDAGLTPRVELSVDPAKAILLGVAADDAAQTARIATGGSIAARLRLADGLVDVLVRSDAAERGDLDAVLRVPVRDRSGRLVPLGDVAGVRRGFEPTIVERENGERVVSVTANPKPGVTIGAVTTPLGRSLRAPGFLPAGVTVAPRGDVEQLIETMTAMLSALGLAVLAVYAILAVLYRSYALPLVVMATVPLASIGALGALYVFRQPLNLYSMLGIVMLVGLVAKNGILLVEYAERAVRAGSDPQAAMEAAARRRFRPIVMTTLAMIAGMLPLALGHAAGAQYRQALGTVVVGGLASSLLLTLFVVPIAYWRLRSSEPVAATAGASDRRRIEAFEQVGGIVVDGRGAG